MGGAYYAPWREDPRPLGGLLQGAYAYLGVSGFWREQRRQAGYSEQGDALYARWRAAASLVVDIMLASEGLTSAGREFVTGMKGTLDAWQHERVNLDALASAERAARPAPVPVGSGERTPHPVTSRSERYRVKVEVEPSALHGRYDVRVGRPKRGRIPANRVRP